MNTPSLPTPWQRKTIWTALTSLAVVTTSPHSPLARYPLCHPPGAHPPRTPLPRWGRSQVGAARHDMHSFCGAARQEGHPLSGSGGSEGASCRRGPRARVFYPPHTHATHNLPHVCTSPVKAGGAVRVANAEWGLWRPIHDRRPDGRRQSFFEDSRDDEALGRVSAPRSLATHHGGGGGWRAAYSTHARWSAR